jgi:hypothetical protein
MKQTKTNYSQYSHLCVGVQRSALSLRCAVGIQQAVIGGRALAGGSGIPRARGGRGWL